MIQRAMTATDPMRAESGTYRATHRQYGGRLENGIELYGTLGYLNDEGTYEQNANLRGFNRMLEGPEIIEMLLWAGHTMDEINASLADGSFMDALVVPGLKHLGPFLDHDDRWGGPPQPV